MAKEVKIRDGRRQDEDGREVGGGECPPNQIGFGGGKLVNIIARRAEIWRT